MNESADLKAADYKRIQETLKYYEAISIVKVEKDPPERYVIEYKLKGFAYAADESVEVAKAHRVQIDLPFGYPHFPPIVKPLTPIYHPDVAEHAIRVADFWQEKTSLVDLIVYIGDMIRGKVYSTDQAFNQEAVEWYKKHKIKLPLDRLKYTPPEETRPAPQPQKSAGIPVKKIVTLTLIVLIGGGGGLAYRDYSLLGGAEQDYGHVQELVENREFQQAKGTAEDAVEALSGVLFLRGPQKELSDKLTNLLNSQRMSEGLQGRVEYKGKYVDMQVAAALDQVEALLFRAKQLKEIDSIPEAVEAYEEAMAQAQQVGQEEVAKEIGANTAMTRHDYYLAVANEDFAEERWQQAAASYAKVVSILENNKDAVDAQAYGKLAKIDQLSLLSKVNDIAEKAVEAEKNKEMEKAIEHHKMIISLVRQGKYGDDASLISLAEYAEKAVERIEEQALVAMGSKWLTDNYQQLFEKHYPGIYGPGLQSPRARFTGYSGRKMVFVLSCVELIQRRSNEFRLYYQYDPVTREWSIYSGN